MRKLYRYETPYGEFTIDTDGDRFFSAFDGDIIDSYKTAAELLEDVNAGNTVSFAGNLKLNDLGLPKDLAAWQRV